MKSSNKDARAIALVKSILGKAGYLAIDGRRWMQLYIFDVKILGHYGCTWEKFGRGEKAAAREEAIKMARVVKRRLVKMEGSK